MVSTTRELLHELVDGLPQDRLEAARAALESLADPVLQALRSAPPDDEPTTPEEDAEAEGAWQAYRQGRSVSNDVLRRELGW